MKILKLLNKKYFTIIFFLFSTIAFTEEKPVDIWNIDKKELENNSLETSNEEVSSGIKNEDLSIYKMQSQKRGERCKHSTGNTTGNRKGRAGQSNNTLKKI